MTIKEPEELTLVATDDPNETTPVQTTSAFVRNYPVQDLQASFFSGPDTRDDTEIDEGKSEVRKELSWLTPAFPADAGFAAERVRKRLESEAEISMLSRALGLKTNETQALLDEFYARVCCCKDTPMKTTEKENTRLPNEAKAHFDDTNPSPTKEVSVTRTQVPVQENNIPETHNVCADFDRFARFVRGTLTGVLTVCAAFLMAALALESVSRIWASGGVVQVAAVDQTAVRGLLLEAAHSMGLEKVHAMEKTFDAKMQEAIARLAQQERLAVFKSEAMVMTDGIASVDITEEVKSLLRREYAIAREDNPKDVVESRWTTQAKEKLQSLYVKLLEVLHSALRVLY